MTVSTSNIGAGPISSPLTYNKTSPTTNTLVEGRTSRSSYVMVEKSSHTRSNSTSSLNVIDDKEANSATDVEQLRDENELLTIKVNKLKYDLKLRDTTVDDLKVSSPINFRDE